MRLPYLSNYERLPSKAGGSPVCTRQKGDLGINKIIRWLFDTPIWVPDKTVVVIPAQIKTKLTKLFQWIT